MNLFLVGWLEGEPVSTTGWFVVDGVARYRGDYTRESARGQGVASTLIQYVQSHPSVQAQDGLVMHCGEGGPVPLYEQLGFRTRGLYYECYRELGEPHGASP